MVEWYAEVDAFGMKEPNISAGLVNDTNKAVQKDALLNGHAVCVYDSDGNAIFKWGECIQIH